MAKKPKSRIITYPDRNYHLIDLNNLGGSRRDDLEYVRSVTKIYIDQVFDVGDHGLVTADPVLMKQLVWDIPSGTKLLLGEPTIDANALISAIDIKYLESKYSTVCIGSGDQVFGTLMQQLQDANIQTVVVGINDCIHPALLKYADRVVELEIPNGGLVTD